MVAYDIKTAVFLVAVIHFANSLFRLALFRNYINARIVLRFGLLSVVGAIAGSLLQKHAADLGLEIGLGALLVVLGGVALLPSRLGWRIPRRADQLGGFLSGLVGNQGALRSGYLLNYPLSKQALIATGTAIACLIDASRIPVYVVNYGARLTDFWPYLVAVILAAFVGTFVGKRLVERLSLPWFRAVVAALIVFTGAGLIFTNP